LTKLSKRRTHGTRTCLKVGDTAKASTATANATVVTSLHHSTTTPLSGCKHTRPTETLRFSQKNADRAWKAAEMATAGVAAVAETQAPMTSGQQASSESPTHGKGEQP